MSLKVIFPCSKIPPSERPIGFSVSFTIFVICNLVPWIASEDLKIPSLPTFGTPCASPEVLVNGSPSPDILDMVTGARSPSSFTTIEEILFVGQLSPSDSKRICKIKCIKGVWVGPMCASKTGSDLFEHPTIKDCQIKPRSTGLVITHNVSQIVLDQVKTFTDQSIIKVRCNEVGLYKFNGFPELQCIKGIWDHPLPQCEETTLHSNFSVDSPPSIVYSVTSGDIGITDTGELMVTPSTVLHLDCLSSRSVGDPEWTWTMAQRQYPTGWSVNEDSRNWRYRLSIYYTNEKDSGQFKCTTPKGHFNTITIRVKENTCPIPLAPPNGRIMDTGHYRTGDYVQYFCNPGYIMIGDGLSICLANGTWSKPMPTCKASCEFPGEPTNGYLIPTKFHYNTGSTITIICKPDYRLQGSSALTCNSDGLWSAPLPFCSPVYPSP